MTDARDDNTEFFLPDFCSAPIVLVVVLIAELTAFVLVIARHLPGEGMSLWLDLARISLFLQWIALSSAGVLCLSRRSLTHIPQRFAAFASYVLLLLVTAILSEIAYQLSNYTGIGHELLPASHAGFVVRNLIVCSIISALMLRYFYIQHQWKRNVQREAHSRIEALQARIRPHFLFNSMNTIASLIRSRPELAERAVEDLADLFRASLTESAHVALREEVALTRQYLEIETLRLGDRLRVNWQIDGLPLDARLPRLTLQPLLENAIYHGVETLAEGGDVEIEGHLQGTMLHISIRNPLPSSGTPRRRGNQMALENVRERLTLAWPGRASVETGSTDDHFRVSVQLPYEPVGP
ncbi:MAG TPA: histidine kinase [Gammaproteobacteria bacterium]|nr:histidine kinase [Gammaproteobacteria bacterium]